MITTKFIDYNQVLDDIKTLLETKIDEGETARPFKFTGTNLNDREYVLDKMPILDVRLSTADPGPRSGQNYFTAVAVEIQITAVDLSSKDKAARIANELLAKAQRVVVENGHYGANWESVVLGHVDFLYGEGEDGGFAASLIAQIVVGVYSDR